MKMGLLTTYPPTQCGLATFSKALAEHLSILKADVNIVRVVDAPQPREPQVASQLVTGDDQSVEGAVATLNGCDVVIVQHEYGIFGGPDGADILEVLAAVRVPVIAVLHTVLAAPTANQLEVLAKVLLRADAVVTLTHAGRQLLISQWNADPNRVAVIPHGAYPNHSERGDVVGSRPMILTWGLLGPGKGIEWALEAIAGLTDLDPRPRYSIVGRTHPRVVKGHGEAYRHSLFSIVDRLGIQSMVRFDNRYLDLPELQSVVRRADVVLLPYDSGDQVTSGVLSEAIVAGKPVVSTPFPHAVELLSTGAGVLVQRGDSGAIEAALRTVMTEPRAALTMARAARGLAPRQHWSSVARAYVNLASLLVRRSARSAVG
jgi:polysaccharide biosynthesis protein PslF